MTGLSFMCRSSEKGLIGLAAMCGLAILTYWGTCWEMRSICLPRKRDLQALLPWQRVKQAMDPLRPRVCAREDVNVDTFLRALGSETVGGEAYCTK